MGIDRKRGKKAERRMSGNLVALTGVTAADVLLHCSRKTRPLEVLLNESLGPRYTIVPRQR